MKYTIALTLLLLILAIYATCHKTSPSGMLYQAAEERVSALQEAQFLLSQQ